jgi:hypothetical protein
MTILKLADHNFDLIGASTSRTNFCTRWGMGPFTGYTFIGIIITTVD